MANTITKKLSFLFSASGDLSLRKKFKQKFAKQGHSVFIACMPKSGSTFLSKAIAQSYQFDISYLNYGFERNEQELYLPALIDNYSRNTVTQQHIKATAPNITLMREFGIRPIILVRNIFDVVISIRDYLLKEGVENFPSLYASDSFVSLTETQQYDFIIANALPWYFNFYASWTDASNSGQIDAKWVNYDRLKEDWHGGIKSIIDFYGLAYDSVTIDQTINSLTQDKLGSRINKGIAGRGKMLLSAKQQADIKAYRHFYPWIDFTSIGIEKNN